MIQTDAIVFNTSALFERDLIVELFTQSCGRIRAFAKYAQSNKPRYGGGLTTFTLIHLGLIQRRTSYTIAQVQAIQAFPIIKATYERLAAAYNIISVAQAISPLDMENTSLFAIIKHTLAQLNDDEDVPSLMNGFYRAVLKNEGVLKQANLSDEAYRTMIESYTGVSLRRALSPIHD